MRFIEWVQQNPGGVISLPTGKTPEHFIKWVQRLTGYLGHARDANHPRGERRRSRETART